MSLYYIFIMKLCMEFKKIEKLAGDKKNRQWTLGTPMVFETFKFNLNTWNKVLYLASWNVKCSAQE